MFMVFSTQFFEAGLSGLALSEARDAGMVSRYAARPANTTASFAEEVERENAQK
jgi:glycerol uptake facilitator-like aquaporin